MLPYIKALAQLPGVDVVRFQNGMWGGARPKWSAWMTNVPELQRLAKTCDHSHEHKRWGHTIVDGRAIYATAEEVAYPLQLCQEAASAVLDHLRRRRVIADEPPTMDNQHQPKRQKTSTPQVPTPSKTSAEAGHQPRGRKLPELIPEFAQTIRMFFDKAALPFQMEKGGKQHSMKA